MTAGAMTYPLLADVRPFVVRGAAVAMQLGVRKAARKINGVRTGR